ncbi:hypothetical protein Clacol_008425 [Clathrus columnatus]|uniref:NAD(P)-binding protein n=1 Tax=Clathrus columnatus TaxID=1419009 RepID=A0AAV5AMU2_9AGAM|nr:hypothetical protein Clacol_008425 [Clathrus columnatus]
MATLEGKIILIFGGSSGLGHSAAEASLKSKASRVIISSSKPEKVSNAVNRLKSANLGDGQIEGHVVDVTDAEALKSFLNQIGEVDHVIWSSGDRLPLGFPNLELDAMKSTLSTAFDVRFWGAIIVAQHAKIRPKGSLTLTVGSVVVKPKQTWTVAAGVMGAVDSITRGLAVDLAPIRVNCICPGVIKTELWDGMPPDKREQFYATVAGNLLLKYVPEPNEVAEAYLFLMKCDYITGQRIQIDGGYSLV